MSYNFDSIVGKHEADALKEMIFRRARERAESMNEEEQNDIMNMARDSFVSKNNPFSQIVENAQKAVENEPKDNGLGFPQREVKPRAAEQARTVQEQAAASAINNTMMEARSGLENRKSFMGALEFLNSQAAVSLMRTRADKFEAVV